jgi:MoxR-like ATPase
MTDLDNLKQQLAEIKAEIAKVIIGQDEVINYMLITIFANSHALLEGVPGIAKTLLVRTIGEIFECPVGRIQFTPDLMPSDITGTNVFNLQNNSFKLVKGPVFTGFLLADEINRAPAKTQSALLQCMQERLVTIDNESYELPHYFTVFATQNPIEYEGTYPLPEAQKDRFLLKINMDYPNEEEERQLAALTLAGNPPDEVLTSGKLREVIKADDLPEIRKVFQQVTVKDELCEYMLQIIRNTRRHSAIMVGAGPRATQSILLSSRICAAIEGRDFVTPDDVKKMAVPVLEHRLILRPEFEIEGVTVSEIIRNILEETAVPR